MKPVTVLLVLFFAGIVSIYTSVKVGASGLSSWTQRPPSVLQNIPVSANIGNTCTGFNQNLVFAELPGSHDVCTFGDERLKIGYFSSSGPYRGAVKFPYSNDWHALEGICGGVICRYSANTDQLVTQRTVGPTAWGLVVYKHASERIHRIQYGSVTKYVFDGERPDYAVKNDVGRFLWTSSYGLSDNGKWLVVELHDSGLLVVNTDSFSERQIITTGYTYGYGRDPYEQLAVSNDGKSVVVAGMNVGLSVIDVTPGCGQALVGDLRQLPSTNSCPSTNLEIGTLFPNFYSSEQPRFFGDGQQLEVVVNSWVGSSKRLTFLQEGATPVHKLKLLSLGDSFTSGEGETDSSYYRPETDGSFDNCHNSSRAYPFLVAKRLGAASNDVQSVACSGARVTDIIGSGDTYWGQGGRLGNAGLKLSLANKATAQQAALDSFQPGRALQSGFFERYNPEAITISVGGNDAGLTGKLKACAMPGTCEWALEQGLRATAGEIRRLYGTLGSLFSYITKHNPDARAYVVGYPDIIDADGPCDASTRYLLNYNERVFINKSIEYLNVVIRAAAQRAGFTYLDIEHSMDGKKLCSGSVLAAMNGVKLGGDIAIISSLPKLKVISAGSFHPTPLGHVLIADAILAGHPGLRQDTNCPSYTPACSLSTTGTGIEPSAYWGVQAATSKRLSYATDFASSATVDSRKLTLDIEGGTFEPASTAELSIRSETATLGTFTADSKGGLVGTVTIPPDFENGYHTLHLSGLNREGSVIDLYQFATIGETESTQAEERVGGAHLSGGDGVASSAPGTKSVQISDQPSTVNPLVPSPILKVADNPAEFMAVLGAQTIVPKGLDSFGPLPAISTQVGSVKEFVKTDKVFVIVIAGLGMLGLAALCAVLLHRRWAKPSS